MRKVLAVFLAATLLCVSSVPAFAEAASCVGPAKAVDMMVGDEHAMHHDGVHDDEDVHLGHDHSSGLTGDWQKQRIECGCGCHRSVESLPHLLAPHIIDTARFHAGIETIIASVQPESVLVYGTVRVPLPPPQAIS